MQAAQPVKAKVPSYKKPSAVRLELVQFLFQAVLILVLGFLFFYFDIWFLPWYWGALILLAILVALLGITVVLEKRAHVNHPILRYTEESLAFNYPQDYAGNTIDMTKIETIILHHENALFDFVDRDDRIVFSYFAEESIMLPLLAFLKDKWPEKHFRER